MRKLLTTIIFLVAVSAQASHIVGGEFELLHIEGYRYRLNLIIYFDVINGAPGARDPDATVRIFRKSDNQPQMDVYMPFIWQTRVEYYQPLCSQGEIITDKLFYSVEVFLSPDVFNDPGGYYVTWERCCRNYTITNIFSEDPQGGNPSAIPAGQTFYLEFPPVVKDGEQFINSSPQLFPPLNDYACPNRPYWVDFAGHDVDNDSMVYSLITPLNTHTPQAIPDGGPSPAPYPNIIWRPGFSLESIVGGSPDLKISTKGFLTVTPQSQGLYTFAVKCEEYRNGEKIGMVIRDFQMLVLDQCPVADPPVIKGKKLEDTRYNYVDHMNISFPNTTIDDDRCIQVEVSDPDALKIEDNYRENIWLDVIAMDFETQAELADVLPDVSSVLLEDGSVHSFDICFDECPLVRGRPYTLGIIAFDDACALPLSDTLRVRVEIEPPDNTAAYFLTNDTTVSMREGEDYQLFIEGVDDDGDTLFVDILTDDFVLEEAGMSFDNTVNANGTYSTTFNWATGCDIYDFTEKTNFEIKIVLDDDDVCDYGLADTITLNLEVILPPNTDPIISSDIPQTNFLHILKESKEFNLFGYDSDEDSLELRVVGEGFLLKDHDITFPMVKGKTQVESEFNWLPDCENVDLNNEDHNQLFTFYFLLNDLDKCKFSNYDTLEVNMTVIPPNNTPPIIRFENQSEGIEFTDSLVSMNVGDFLSLEVIAEDAENNEIELRLTGDTRMPAGAVFDPVTGEGSVSSFLNWLGECINLGSDFMPMSYMVSFMTMDDMCFNEQGDTTSIQLNISDIETKEEVFLPPNIFTPNKDGINDYYSLDNLPLDNCEGHFVSFKVHNRWGVEVFVTNDRDFEWYAEGVEAGVYYYVVEFTNKEYNGPLTILY